MNLLNLVNLEKFIDTRIEAKFADNVQISKQMTNFTITNNGLTNNEVKELFFILWENNAPKLISEALSTQKERIANYADNLFLPQITEQILEGKFEKFKEPDIQNDCYNILKIVANKNDEQINKVLTNIMTAKINSQDNFDEIVCSQAIKTMENVSAEQLKILGLRYINAKDISINNVSINFNELQDKIVQNLLDFDINKIHRYIAALVSNGIAYHIGGWAAFNDDDIVHSIISTEAKQIIKDAFCNLDLTPTGEKIAFEYLSTAFDISCNMPIVASA